MLSKKVFVSSLLASCLAFSANAGVKLTKTTDGNDFTEELKGLAKAFGDTKKKDNVMTEAEKVFLETGKNIYVGDAAAEKRGKKKVWLLVMYPVSWANSKRPSRTWIGRTYIPLSKRYYQPRYV